MFENVDLKAAHVAGFFKDIKYFSTGDLSDKVAEALRLGGAKNTAYLSFSNSHCIVGTNPEYSDINEATDMLDVPAVTQDWVLTSLHCKKLLPLKAFSPSKSRIFHGIRALLVNLAPRDVDAAWALLTYHGAQVSKELSSSVTHVVAGRPAGELYTSALSIAGAKSVSLDWVQDSVKAGSRAVEAPYHPRLLRLPDNRPKPMFKESSKPVSGPTIPPAAAATSKPEAERPQAGRLTGAMPTRLPGPPQLGQQRLPGPPQLGGASRPPLHPGQPVRQTAVPSSGPGIVQRPALRPGLAPAAQPGSLQQTGPQGCIFSLITNGKINC